MVVQADVKSSLTFFQYIEVVFDIMRFSLLHVRSWKILKTLFFLYSFVPNCRGSNKMHQGGKLSRFLKIWRLFLGHSLIIKWTWRFFSQNLQFDAIRHKRKLFECLFVSIVYSKDSSIVGCMVNIFLIVCGFHYFLAHYSSKCGCLRLFSVNSYFSCKQ